MKATTKFTVGMGERIRFVRVRANLSQQELGENLSVSRQSISGYETERLRPSSSIIEKLCDQYMVKPWWILYGVDSPADEFAELATGSIATQLSRSTDNLSNAQKTLIDYIVNDQDAAQNLAKMLWNKALDL